MSTAGNGHEAQYTSISGDEMADIVRGMGFAAELATDSQGDPMIRLRIEGMRSLILFYGCSDGRATSMQFTAGFAVKIPLDKINDWNRTKRFGKAFHDADGDAVVQLDVDLDGGVSRKYLEELLIRWRVVFTGFVSFIA